MAKVYSTGYFTGKVSWLLINARKPQNFYTLNNLQYTVYDEVLLTAQMFVVETYLPGWLVWMINEEEKASNTLQHSFIQEQKRKRGM